MLHYKQFRQEMLDNDAAFRGYHEKTKPEREAAPMLVGYRVEHSLSRDELAALIGLSASRIKALEELDEPLPRPADGSPVPALTTPWELVAWLK